MLTSGALYGHLRLLERLGEGGMGEVWEGVDERLGRRVAVKAIRHESTDPLARARFAREARILSRLEHENICRLYELLETPAEDLLVLELVRGRQLQQAIARGLTPSQRLSIARGVAEALVAAHAQSVVHRDLKPDNVMVTPEGTVKVLDFGIAREASGDDGESTIVAAPTAPASGALTAVGDILGTPRSMSPEQARGEPVTAASDMFCFGLLLFELYTGRSPYAAGTPGELLIRAQWGDVPTPAGIPKLVSALIRDLTHLDPHQRLSAPAALARLREIERRPLRRLRVAAVAVAALGLLVGLTLSLFGLARARREARTAEATTAFLERLFAGSDPQEAPNPEVKARDVLDRGVERLREELAGEPAVRGRLLTTLGGIYGNLGLHGKARPLLEEALRLTEAEHGPDDAAVVPVLNRLANALDGLGEYVSGEQQARRAVAVATAQGSAEERARALDQLTTLVIKQGRLDEAEALAREAESAAAAAHGRDHPRTATAMVHRALIEIDRGHPAAAEPMLIAALAIFERHLPADHADIGATVNNLATVAKEQGRLPEAERLYTRALGIVERRLGPRHPSCAVVRNDLAVAIQEQGRYAEAETEYRRAVELAEATLGATHPLTAIFVANLADATLLQGRASAAEPLFRRALEALRPALGAEHPAIAESLRGLGRACAAQGRHGEAVDLLVESARVREKVSGSAHPELGKVLTQLGALYLDQGETGRAALVLGRARQILEPALPPHHPMRVELAATLARLPPAGGSP